MEFQKKRIKGLVKRHTNPEKIADNIIIECGFPFIYTGDGKVVIGGFCPDFTDNNGSKKLIEIFGDYWHKRPEVIIRDTKRLETYTKYGFSTLIIWEHELKDKNKVAEKIRGFL